MYIIIEYCFSIFDVIVVVVGLYCDIRSVFGRGGGRRWSFDVRRLDIGGNFIYLIS